MEIRYNVTGAERKALVEAIAKIAGTKAVYKKAPTFEYEVGSFVIDRYGTVTCEDADALERLVHNLIADGFTAEENAADDGLREENRGLTVEIPMEKVSVGNLTKLLDAKGNLIKKALGITDLRMELLDDRVAFPWFEQVDVDSAAAYTHFISALCEMSRNAKRVTVTEKTVENEKYAFRCFLLRLGFIGTEYKAERKILLQNLSGSSAFKNGGVDHAVSE